MAVSFRFVPKYSAVLVKATGVLTLEEIIEFLGSIADDPAVPADHVTLFDASEVTAMDLSKEDIGKISSFTQSHPSNKIIARKLAIVTKGSEETKLAEEYERLAATFRETTIVFYHHDIACKWLGIPQDIYLVL